jgi:hypothetical protein
MIANLNPDSWHEKFQNKRHYRHWSAPASDHNASYRMTTTYPQLYALDGLRDITQFTHGKGHPTTFRGAYQIVDPQVRRWHA